MQSLKNMFFGLLSLVLLHQSANAQFTDADFLKANGTVLRNEHGEGDTVVLRGTNLGSWLSMEYWMMPLGTGSIGRDNWTASVAGSDASDFSTVFDRNLATGWTSAASQQGGEVFLVDMGKNEVFNRISFEVGEFSDNYPTQFKIEVSETQATWTSVTSGSGSSDGIFLQLPNIYEARYIRITQTGSSSNPWSIAEFNTYMEDDFHVRNSLANRFGEDGMDTILNHFQHTWIQEKDLDNVKDMGMNLVRVPFYWMEIMYNDGKIKPHGFDQLDWVIEQCTEREIYVILDMHGGPGGWNGFITSGQAYTNDLWTDEESQLRTVKIWEALSERYKGNPTVAMYDLMNEPLSSNQSLYPIHEVYDLLYDAVRAIDQEHVISIGAFPVFSFVVGPEYYGWENVLYQAHHYNEDKQNYSSQKGFIEWAIRDMASYQHHWNVPILAGEFNFWDFPDLWKQYLSGCNGLNISWSNWAYKNSRVDQPVENWAFYDNNTRPKPNIHYDTPEEIIAKWSEFGTENFRENTELIETVSSQTGGDAVTAPVGQMIRFKVYNGNYLSVPADGVMNITNGRKDATNRFEVVDAGQGRIALKGSNDQYLSVSSDRNTLTCTATEIGENETFTYIPLGGNRIALEGPDDLFVSAENGSIPVASNRTYIDGYEIFQLELVNLLTKTPSGNLPELYPNPADSYFSIGGTFASGQVVIYKLNGKVVKQYDQVQPNEPLSTEELAPGLYQVQLQVGKKTLNKKLIVR
ncbi:cellulase family glycosylhydrolase [Marinoscillum sp.]|uniref:cellulase family glycosylhydrolase n=1 Tax=Marinoscillum sp. TaxID=2024838 RepID=UPI003BA856D4